MEAVCNVELKRKTEGGNNGARRLWRLWIRESGEFARKERDCGRESRGEGVRGV